MSIKTIWYDYEPKFMWHCYLTILGYNIISDWMLKGSSTKLFCGVVAGYKFNLGATPHGDRTYGGCWPSHSPNVVQWWTEEITMKAISNFGGKNSQCQPFNVFKWGFRTCCWKLEGNHSYHQDIASDNTIRTLHNVYSFLFHVGLSWIILGSIGILW